MLFVSLGVCSCCLFLLCCLASAKIEEERTKMRSQEAAHKDISLNWLKERDDLKKQMNEVRAKAEELDSAVAAKEKKIKELVNQLFSFHFSTLFRLSPVPNCTVWRPLRFFSFVLRS